MRLFLNCSNSYSESESSVSAEILPPPLSDFPPDTSYVVELEVPASAEVVAVIAVEIVFDADAVDVVKTVVG